MENINDLIDKNLSIIFQAEDGETWHTNFVDIEGNKLFDNFRSTRFAEQMEKRGLIEITNELSTITEFGYSVAKNGGWLRYLESKNEREIFEEKKSSERSKLEIQLAKSNLEANELNKRIAKRNKKNEKNNTVATWINILIGAINIGLLAWQILKQK